MDRPTNDQFQIFIEHVERSLPLLEKTITANQDLNGKNRWNERSLRELQVVKKVSEWLQREIFGEFYCRYKQ